MTTPKDTPMPDQPERLDVRPADIVTLDGLPAAIPCAISPEMTGSPSSPSAKTRCPSSAA